MIYVKGRVAHQAHVALPAGTFEEEHGRKGFSGRSSELYHLRIPTGWTRIEGPLRPRCFEGERAEPPDLTDPNGQPLTIAANEDVALLISRRSAPMPFFFRDADGDEVYFVHRGNGVFETDYGPLTYEPGDYLYFPKATTFQIVPRTKDNFFLVIRSRAELNWPDRGLMGLHAFVDPSRLRTPEPSAHDESRGEWELRVLRRGQLTSIFYPHHPLDVVGWRGELTPFALNVREMRPIVSDRYHLPPTVHATLVSDPCSICTFAPRPLETGEGCTRVPYFHRNVDWDEVIFYHSGEFFSRPGIEPGAITIHPQGIDHGPHPKAFESTGKKAYTNEVAVLVETRDPLRATEEAAAIEQVEYATNWIR